MDSDIGVIVAISTTPIMDPASVSTHVDHNTPRASMMHLHSIYDIRVYLEARLHGFRRLWVL